MQKKNIFSNPYFEVVTAVSQYPDAFVNANRA